MGVRSANLIGDLWPRCKACGHIAQAHGESDCCEQVYGQCPTCSQYGAAIPCKCNGYDGPSLKEFMDKHMTPEEKEYYSKQWNVK